MSIKLHRFFLALCFVYFPSSSGIEPLTTGFGLVTIGALFSSVYFGTHVRMPWHEQCDQKWNGSIYEDLNLNLEKHLFGQHLVAETVTKNIRAHILKNESTKALAMAFHGWTGGGKNHVAKIIADTLFKKGSKSDFVHWYITTRDFPHAEESKIYRIKLLQEIAQYTKECGQSLFIFDEVDKMPPGVIDALKPFLDFYEDLDGIDYRRNIFIFLSNAGGSEITKVALNFWLDGKDREEITMKDIEPLVNKGAFNEKGGLYHSEVIGRNLIDVYIPFLPLEKRHIRKCIVHEMLKRGFDINKDIIDKIEEQMIYYPHEFQLYSTSGCKKVSNKVDIYGYDE